MTIILLIYATSRRCWAPWRLTVLAQQKEQSKRSPIWLQKTKTGINISDLLLKLTKYKSKWLNSWETIHEDLIWHIPMIALMPCIPSDCKNTQQLWKPLNKEEKSINADNREVLHGVPGSQVELAFKSYYTRLFRNARIVVENRKIKLYFYLWLDYSIVYSLSHYTDRKFDSKDWSLCHAYLREDMEVYGIRRFGLFRKLYAISLICIME